MVGVGTFVDKSFLLRQYFLREPTEETGMLFALQEVLDTVEGFVTFNGRVFDIPLLEMRYMMGMRLQWPLTAWPQFDLLHPSRRLWRQSLPDCTLSTLESRQLGVERTGEDVPGELIPGIYLEYLRTGDTNKIGKIFYHNAIDILTLVVLATQILDRHQNEDPSGLAGSEALAVARWHQKQGRYEGAEIAYRQAIESTNLPVRQDALRLLSLLLKKHDRRDEAVPIWETLHRMASHDPWPCVELAKYYEWHALDLDAAKSWAEAAMVCLTHWEADWRRDQAWGELEHRLSRIVRKLEENQEE
jgi:tetratricopeptide (TPR) repeat protein